METNLAILIGYLGNRRQTHTKNDRNFTTFSLATSRLASRTKTASTRRSPNGTAASSSASVQRPPPSSRRARTSRCGERFATPSTRAASATRLSSTPSSNSTARRGSSPTSRSTKRFPMRRWPNRPSLIRGSPAHHRASFPAKARMIALARGAAMSQIAASFLRRCFAPEETIAILLRRQDAAAPMQRVVRLEQALETRYMAWLSYENQHGRNNIYVAANPLRPGSRKRTKESIASVRHLYLDIDTDGDARLAALRASELVPPPTSILSTSPGKYQVLWRVEGFDFARQEQIAQAARHRLRRRSSLHRLQPCPSRPRFPQSQVRSRLQSHCRISR